ncbi:hypothetical protein LCGC14_2218670 [marine sediment metagenome]|uniref:Uncharacterized protein n=1 Tax=marine sediment metagenome TaxID=412755 RepID=A0A0F9DZ65_9ZZZZ
MIKSKNYKLQLAFYRVLDTEMGIVDYPIFEISKMVLSQLSINNTFDLLKKELNQFIIDKKIEDKKKKKNLLNV